MTHGHHGHSRKSARKERQRVSFKHRYGGLTRKEWAQLKKEDPKKAQEIRIRALKLLITK